MMEIRGDLLLDPRSGVGGSYIGKDPQKTKTFESRKVAPGWKSLQEEGRGETRVVILMRIKF